MINEETYQGYDYELWFFADDDYPAQGTYNYKIIGITDYGDPNDFETLQEARFAAIGHIALLEKGEG